MATNRSSRATNPAPASSLVSTFLLLLTIFALAALVGTLASCSSSTSKASPSNPLPPDPSPPGEAGGALGQAVKYREQIVGDFAPPYELENHYLQNGMYLGMPDGSEPFFFKMVDATPIVDEQDGVTLSTTAIAPGGLVYNKGYYYSKQGWVPFSVVPDVPEGEEQQWIKTRRDESGNIVQTNWVRIRAKAGLHFSAQEFYDAFPEGQNFIVNYVCLKPNPVEVEPWKCGCKAPAEGEGPTNDCGYWMVQTFDVCSAGKEWDDNAEQCIVPAPVAAEAAVVEEEQAPLTEEAESLEGDQAPIEALVEEETQEEAPGSESGEQPSAEGAGGEPEPQADAPAGEGTSAEPAPENGDVLIGAGGSSASGPADGGVTDEEAAPQEAPQETITPTEEAPTGSTTPPSDVSGDTGTQEQQPVEIQPIDETPTIVEETPPVALTATCTAEPSPYDGSDMALCIPANTPTGEGMASYFTTGSCLDASTVLYPVCGSDGSCLVDSSNTFDCAATNRRCDGGQCVQKKVDGDACTVDVECGSGSCINEACTTPTPETVPGGETPVVETIPEETTDATTTPTSPSSITVQDATGNAVNDVMVQFSSEAMGESIPPPELLTSTSGSGLPEDVYTITLSKEEYATVTLYGVKLPGTEPLAVVLSPLCTSDSTLLQCPVGQECVLCPRGDAVQCSSSLDQDISACTSPAPRGIGSFCLGNDECGSGTCYQSICSPAVLYGTLIMFTMLPDDMPAAGVPITIAGPTGTFEATSDVIGRAQLLIPQGVYGIMASAEGILTQAQATVMPSISSEVWLRFGYREVRLAVYDSNNLPLQGVMYTLVDITDSAYPRVMHASESMGVFGSVVFSLDYGTYEITVTPSSTTEYLPAIQTFTVGSDSPSVMKIDVTLQQAPPPPEESAALPSSCASNVDCLSTERCDLATMACVPLLYDGGFEVSGAVRLVTAPSLSSYPGLSDPIMRAAVANPHEWITTNSDASITSDMPFSGAKSLQIIRDTVGMEYVAQASPVPAGTYRVHVNTHVPSSGGTFQIKFIRMDASGTIKYQNIYVPYADSWQSLVSNIFTLSEDSYLFVGMFPSTSSGTTHWDDIVVWRVE